MLQNQIDRERDGRKNTGKKISWSRDNLEETKENGLMILPKKQKMPQM